MILQLKRPENRRTETFERHSCGQPNYIFGTTDVILVAAIATDEPTNVEAYGESDFMDEFAGMSQEDIEDYLASEEAAKSPIRISFDDIFKEANL